MAERVITVWFDREGDLLEVMFDRRASYFRETDSEHVMQKVDRDGNIVGFSITNVSKLNGKPLEVAL